MSFTTTPILHPYANAEGLHKVNILVIHRRMKVYAPTDVKVKKENFDGLYIVNHPLKEKLNGNIGRKRIEIEGRIHDALKYTSTISKPELIKLVKGVSKDTLRSFVEGVIAEEGLAEGTKRQYRSHLNKIDAFQPNLTISQVNETWLLRYEKHLKEVDKNDSNTINSNMKRIKGWLNRAAAKGMIDEKAFKNYSPPSYVQKIPEYLLQSEVDKIGEVLPDFDEQHRTAGYHFLLGCYAGYRISDLKRFGPDRIKDGRLILRANKNKKIVSLLIYPKLEAVLQMVLKMPFDMAEETMRRYVKEICQAAGIKRNIKIHTARHTFGMMLADKGFSIEEAAELLGDSVRVAAVYFRMSNARLDEKVRDRLK
jgi:site-specific recombinase XerD